MEFGQVRYLRFPDLVRGVLVELGNLVQRASGFIIRNMLRDKTSRIGTVKEVETSFLSLFFDDDILRFEFSDCVEKADDRNPGEGYEGID